jgi:hypothetical protein
MLKLNPIFTFSCAFILFRFITVCWSATTVSSKAETNLVPSGISITTRAIYLWKNAPKVGETEHPFQLTAFAIDASGNISKGQEISFKPLDGQVPLSCLDIYNGTDNDVFVGLAKNQAVKSNLDLTAEPQTLISLTGTDGSKAFSFFGNDYLDVCQVQNQKLMINNNEKSKFEIGINPDCGEFIKVLFLQNGFPYFKFSNKEFYSTNDENDEQLSSSTEDIPEDPFLIRLTDGKKQLKYKEKETATLSGSDTFQPDDLFVLRDKNGNLFIYSKSKMFLVPIQNKAESVLFVPKAKPSSVRLPLTHTMMTNTFSIDKKYYIAWHDKGHVHLCFSSEL